MADSEAHVRKRLRLSDTDVDGTRKDIQHHGKLWFKDGNIVLLAGTTAFKLHQGVLSHHSTVFCDMFALPQPPSSEAEEFEGCPCVVLQDDPEQLAEFLSVLYDGGKQ